MLYRDTQIKAIIFVLEVIKMDIVMDVAQVAMSMKTMSVRTESSLKVMKMAMDVVEQEGADLMKLIDAAMTGIGQNIDIMA